MSTPAQREAVARVLYEADGIANIFNGRDIEPYLRRADELIAAYEAAAWQPIETAPKPPLSDTSADRYIIGYCPLEHEHDRVRVIWWEPNLHGGMWQDDRELDKFGGPKPTRWQPMLSPPKDHDHD